MMKRVELLTIDPQFDFCDPTGKLSVAGAMDDMVRLSSFIKKRNKSIYGIKCTLDSHQKLHIAHPPWYKDDKGNNPNPFTIMGNVNGVIVGSDSKVYKCTIPSMQSWTLDYLRKLEEGKKFPHCIWPVHCEIGKKGHNVVECLSEAFDEWCLSNLATIDFLTKGSNPKVEHFSAVKAEINDPNDFTTSLNSDFIGLLTEADEILLSGEALSHCLFCSVRDIADEFNGGTLGTSDEFIKKCVLLSDCSSNVPGFEAYGEKFVKEMSLRGMRVTTTKDY